MGLMIEKAMDSWNIFAKTGAIQDYLNYKQLENQLAVSKKGTEIPQSFNQNLTQEFH